MFLQNPCDIIAPLFPAWSDKISTPQSRDAGNVGYPSTQPDVCRQMVQLIHNAGVHVSTQAIGDRAIDWVVDTYDQVLKAKPTPGLRHGIIHASMPTAHAIDSMARLEKTYDAAYPESQAGFLWWLGDNLVRSLGPDRVSRMKPFGTKESVDVKTALRSYTIWTAYQMFLEKKVGSLEAGKEADIAVWDRDLYTVPTDSLKDMKCKLTMPSGKIVYRTPN